MWLACCDPNYSIENPWPTPKFRDYGSVVYVDTKPAC